jgi:hypothetical protein
MIEIDKMEDFFPINGRRKVKCYSHKCKNTSRNSEMYLTEWELNTGASSEGGLIYCIQCIINKLTRS